VTSLQYFRSALIPSRPLLYARRHYSFSVEPNDMRYPKRTPSRARRGTRIAQVRQRRLLGGAEAALSHPGAQRAGLLPQWPPIRAPSPGSGGHNTRAVQSIVPTRSFRKVSSWLSGVTGCDPHVLPSDARPPAPVATISEPSNLLCPPGVFGNFPSCPSGVTNCDPHVLLSYRPANSKRPRAF
jgi:hypothetical protein